MRFFVLIAVVFLFGTGLSAQSDTTISWKSYTVAFGYIGRIMRPVDFQLYPRDSSNKAVVEIGGNNPSSDSVKIVCRKIENGIENTIYSRWIPVTAGNFSTAVTIQTGLFEYNFYYQLSVQRDSILRPIAAHVVCGDVFVVSGQSNADTWDLSQEEVIYLNTRYGPGFFSFPNNPYAQFCRSFEAGLPFEVYPPWSLSAVAHYGYRHLGAWAKIIQFELVKRYKVPVLFINNASGGTDISNNQLPGPNEFYFNSYTYTICPEGAEISPTKTYRLFSRLNSNIYMAGVEKSVKGIFWMQGDAADFDRVHGYGVEFKKLHDLWMKFFPGFKTYFIQVHSWIESEDAMRQISEDQRTLKDSIPDLFLMSSNGIGYHRKEPGHEIHFRAEGYETLAYRLLAKVENVQYGKNVPEIDPPNLIGASRSGNIVRLYFNQTISSTLSDDPNNVLSLIKFNSGYNVKSQPIIQKNKLIFSISDTTVSSVSYAGFIPGKNINGTYHADPDFPGYLRNRNGVAALSFHNVPLHKYDASSSYETFIPPGEPVVVIPDENKFYPNPLLESSLHIEVPEKAKEVTITNVQGVIMKKEEVDAYQLSIDLSDLPGGMYFVSVITENGNYLSRIIKQ